jgi:ppGpp synthetase/RelA/SpoT-type nucleotidyltranferase
MEKIDLQKLTILHSGFTPILHSLVEALLNSENIKFHIVESRTKEIISLENKIIEKNITDISKVQDLSGLRVILYYSDDIDRVDKLIKKNFNIDKPNSINKADILENNEFGYLSVHYIVSLDKKRNELPEWKNYSTLFAEIQVRTVLQHSWASISHELSYKKKLDIPKELSRKLFRLAGIFELADEQFLDIRNQHNLLESKIQKITKKNEFNQQKINSITVAELIKRNWDNFSKITDIANESGFGINTYESKNTSRIIELSQILKLKTIGSFNDLLFSEIDKVEKFIINLNPNDLSWNGNLNFFLEISLLVYANESQLETYWKSTSRNWSLEPKDRVIDSLKKL